jgi:hypothetical protein
MRKLSTIRVVVALAILSIVAPSFAESRFSVAGIENDKSVYDFLHKLQVAVARDDRKAVASMVLYPLAVGPKPGHKSVMIRNPAAFIRRYRWIVNARVKRAILKQKASELFCRDLGVMIGDGDVWFGLDNYQPQIRIDCINHI